MAMGLLGGLGGMGGMCFICNSYSCHHLMQGQQQAMHNQYENYLKQQMGMANQMVNSQMQQTRSFDIAEAVDKQKEEKKCKLLLLLR